MYPNLYYIFKDWFGVNWHGLSFLNTFGLFVALGFVTAAIVLSSELQRKEKQGLLSPREEMITVGKPASFLDILINGIVGFIFGYKIFGLFISKAPEINPQDYIFSSQGNLLGGLLLGGLLAWFKWYDKNKQRLKEPERRNVRIWPHDRVGDIIILGLIFGIIGAKLFDNLENWSDFVKDPIGRLFSASGLTFYGGLILAAIAICWYASKKGITIIHLVDAAGLALLLAYAVGRIGCQVSGDGDWGVFNSAYVVNAEGKVVEVNPSEQGSAYQNQLNKNAAYYLRGEVPGKDSALIQITDRTYESLEKVPQKAFKGPSFLPKWMFAYTYPNNVNKDGVLIPGCKEEHCRALPQPVFPTPFYETVVCTLLFLLLWSVRKRIATPGIMFGIYLILNGIERFTVELIRVNNTFPLFGLHSTQAEVISASLVLAGIILIIIVKRRAATKA